jgi:hypothetical protein
MKKYHIIVALACVVLAFFYLKTELVLSGVGSIFGTNIQIASVHVNYLTGVFAVIIIAYLIRNQESQ